MNRTSDWRQPGTGESGRGISGAELKQSITKHILVKITNQRLDWITLRQRPSATNAPNFNSLPVKLSLFLIF